MTYHGIGGAGYVLPGAQVYQAVVAAAAGGGGFAPTDISGCVLWLDGSDATTLFTDTAGTTAVSADGDSIARWSDKSGNGSNLISISAGRRGTYTTAHQNGLSVVYFDSIDDYGDTTSQTPDALTFFFVIYPVSPGRLTLGRGTTGDYRYQIYSNNFYVYHDGPGFNNASIASWSGSYDVLIGRFDGSAISLSRKIGATSGSASLGGTLRPTPGPWRLAGGFNADAYIAEIIIYNSALSTTDRESVESYLATKWGL